MSGGYLTLGAYFTNITIGTPGTQFSVLVDTGSSNTGVPTFGCPNCGGPKTPTYFPDDSDTSDPIICDSVACSICNPDKDNAEDCLFGPPICASYFDQNLCAFGITYGGGSSALGGVLINDQICLGDLCVDSTVSAITAQYNFASNYNDSIFLGILGLTYEHNACNPTCVVPIYDQIANEGLADNLFSVCLTGTDGGILDLGFIDDSKYEGDIDWVPVIVEDWYNIALLDILVGDVSIGLPEFAYITTNDVIGAFVDSGTSIILLSPLAMQGVTTVFQTDYCDVPGVCMNTSPNLFSGSFCVPQDVIDIDQFPEVTFVFDGEDGEVMVDVSPDAYLQLMGDQYCLGIQSAIGVGAVLGDVFMVDQYIVFDRVNERLGFATLTECM